MSGGIQYDEAWSRRIETVYVTPDVVAQREAVVKALDLQPGERVLDIGSGPGLLAREMATKVGESGAVSGIDLSESMIVLAERRCADLPWVNFRPGDAIALPYEDGSFDVATATQVYNYVGDLPVALRELYRVLRPGGRALVLETDFATLIWNTTDHERMRRVLTAWLEHSAHPYLPRTLAPLLRDAGLQSIHEAVFPLFNPRYASDTISYGLIDFIASFIQERAGVTAEEAQAWADELRERGQADEYFFSLNRYIFLAVNPES